MPQYSLTKTVRYTIELEGDSLEEVLKFASSLAIKRWTEEESQITIEEN